LSESEIAWISQALTLYTNASGQKINHQKSNIIINRDNTTVYDEKSYRRLLAILIVMIISITWEPLFSKVGQKSKILPFFYLLFIRGLALWQTKYISFAGRVTLVKSALSSIPQYVFRSCYFQSQF